MQAGPASHRPAEAEAAPVRREKPALALVTGPEGGVAQQSSFPPNPPHALNQDSGSSLEVAAGGRSLGGDAGVVS